MSSLMEENRDGVNEPIKTKKSQRNKQKANGKEVEESSKNGIDCHEEENNSADVTEINGFENGTEEVNEEKGETENGDFNYVCGNDSETQNGKHEKSGIAPEKEEVVEVETNEEKPIESTKEEKNETEGSVKNDESVITEPERNGTTTEEDGETSQNGMNGSDSGSHYEDAYTVQKVELTPAREDRKEDTSISNRISGFLGKWNSEEDSQKSGGNDGIILNHPYLSKVSGRRGIKERLNSSMSSFEKKDETPKNTLNLDDSFRVRTNPTRLNSAEIEPTLRKFKGKRCLNSNDSEEDSFISKRRKLEEKDPGLLGNILWTPFKKKPQEPTTKMATTGSKLSRFLSPFWFWKKTEGQKGK